MRYSIRASVLALVIAGPSIAHAQIPLKPPALPPADTSKSDVEPTTEDADVKDRDYPRPEPVVLPPGPGRDLKGPVRVVAFDAMVNPGMGEHFIEALAEAELEGAQLLLVELDTPGGLVSTTERMVQAMLQARIPVVVHVTPSGAHAASAGTFITMAAHVAAMAPATRIGAAHPVTGGGQDPEAAGGKHMAAKVENDLAALATGIATERHRNASWAEDAVRRSVSATAQEAVELGVVDLVARDRTALFEALEGRELMLNDEKVVLHPQQAPVTVHALSLRNRVLNLIASPGIAALLLVMGLIGVLVEINHPGMVAPGVLGVLCILCSLVAADQLPIDVGAALLVLAGIGLLVAELYTPTFGALGLMGIIALIMGLTLLVDPSDPDYAIDPSIRLTMWDVLPLATVLGGFVAYLSYFIASNQRRGAFTGREALVGASGKVLRPVGPDGGQVFVAGEYWQATAPEDIDVDAPIKVVSVRDLKLEVKRDDG